MAALLKDFSAQFQQSIFGDREVHIVLRRGRFLRKAVRDAVKVDLSALKITEK